MSTAPSPDTAFRLGDLGAGQLLAHAQDRLLLEASAGTGKTYSLERMVLHLLVRPDNPVDLRNILMVTFTEAATQEIRERVRKLLFVYLHDPEARRNLQQELGLPGEPDPETLALLEGQLDAFAGAHIHTIHGFCTWVLTRFALEAGLPRRFVMDQKALADAVRDYLRERILPGTPWRFTTPEQAVTISDPAEQAFLLRSLLDTGENKGADADDLPGILCDALSKGYTDSRLYRFPSAEVHRAWDAIQDCLADTGIPAGLSLLEAVETGTISHESTEWVTFSNRLKEELGDLDDMPGGEIRGTFVGADDKKNPGAPSKTTKGSRDAAISFCRNVAAWHLIDLVCTDFRHHAAQRPDSGSRLGFDDLIKRTHQLVTGSDGVAEQVRDTISREFRAVLLDEFQDTDPLQWDIFSSLFMKKSLMVAVGDPKQAIYAFRGADLGTFLSARPDFGQGRELLRNFRSSAPLQHCINTLFGHAFGVCKDDAHNIDCPVVQPGRPENAGPFILRGCAGNPLPPLGLLKLTVPVESEWGAGKLRRGIFRLATSQIRTLLDGNHFLSLGSDDGASGPRPLKPEDICILVESFRNGEALRDMLSRSGIPASIEGRGNLKDSREMAELEAFCRALQEPRDDGVVRLFLLTRPGGLTWQELETPRARRIMEKMRFTLHQWKQDLPVRGFLPVFQDLVRDACTDGTDLWVRVLAAEGSRGLRSKTNFLHLAELFQNWIADHPQGLIRPGDAFCAFRESLSGSDDSPLRLERDRGAVRIMTQHASKGLEFPVTFAMTGLKSDRNNAPRGLSPDMYDIPWVPGRTGPGRCVHPWKLEMKDDGDRKKAIKARGLHEALRLAYVAATRAQALLYLPWMPGDGKKALVIQDWNNPEYPPAKKRSNKKNSPPTPPPAPVRDAILDMSLVEGHTFTVDAPAPAPDAPGAPPSDPGNPEAESNPALPDTPQTSLSDRIAALAASLSRPLPEQYAARETCSFTSLKRQAEGRGGNPHAGRSHITESELRGIEEEPAVPDPAVSRSPAPADNLPRGKDWGIAVHDTLEELDFADFLQAWDADLAFRDAPALERLARVHLGAMDRASSLLPAEEAPVREHPLCREIHHALTARLGTTSEAPTFSLADLARRNGLFCHREIGFQAVIPSETRLMGSLQKIFPDSPLPEEGIRLGQGQLTGALDLLFRSPDGKWHIVDWKTNTPPSPGTGSVAHDCREMMLHSAYYLQALIYHSILHLWLSAHGQADRTGQVWYLFTRAGLAPAAPGSASGSPIPEGPSPWAVEASSLTRDSLEAFIRESGIRLEPRSLA